MHRRLLIGIGAAASAIALGGCATLFTSYVYLETPSGGVARQLECGNLGPPSIVSYEKNGVQFEFALDSGARVRPGFLRIRAPAGVVVTIPRPTAYIVFPDTELPSATAFELRRVSTQPIVYEFTSVAPIERPGRLTLPAVVVDGNPIELPTLRFERRRHAGVVPSSC